MYRYRMTSKCHVSIVFSLCSGYTFHYSDVIMRTMAYQITAVSMVCSTVWSDGDQGKHLSSASLAFVGGIHRWPVNSPHKGPVTLKMFPFDDVIMRPTWLEVSCQFALEMGEKKEKCRNHLADAFGQYNHMKKFSCFPGPAWYSERQYSRSRSQIR